VAWLLSCKRGSIEIQFEGTMPQRATFSHRSALTRNNAKRRVAAMAKVRRPQSTSPISSNGDGAGRHPEGGSKRRVVMIVKMANANQKGPQAGGTGTRHLGRSEYKIYTCAYGLFGAVASGGLANPRVESNMRGRWAADLGTVWVRQDQGLQYRWQHSQ
jgi:hypothetical protein